MQKGAGQKLIRFDNVGLRFPGGIDVFKNINFSLLQGTFHFLTGPSGAGKSCMLRLIHLSERQSQGTISLFDRDSTTIKRWEVPIFRTKMSVVFQDFRLIPHLSALDNVALPLQIRGVSTHTSRKQASELLDWVGLSDHLDLFPKALSGGQMQRVAIARAVITRPQLLLADEPTGNVDDQNALKIMYLFEELNKTGTTVIIATHNRSLAKEFPYSELYLHDKTLTVNLPKGAKSI